MRTIERTNQFKRDYKRETKGRSRAYVQELFILGPLGPLNNHHPFELREPPII